MSQDITDNAVQESVKRINHELPTFKKKGNEDQYHRNLELSNAIKSAMKSLHSDDNKAAEK